MSLFKRKSIASIVGPLRKMRDELKEAIAHHDEQAEFHNSQVTHHRTEANDAETYHQNLSKLIGGE